MANWSGSYSIVAGTTGTSTGSNTSVTFNNTGATWPTGAQSLTNFTVRILTGTGAGQTRVISSNTATQLTVPAWGIIPDTSSTYEIVLILKNNDHVTAAFTIGTNCITELEDSATIRVDGVYIITLSNNCVVRWNKSETTLVSFEGNNRTIVGKAGFWNYLSLSSLNTPPLISYLKIRDATYCLVAVVVTAGGDFSGVHHLWFEDVTNNFSFSLGSIPAKFRIRNFLYRNTNSANTSFIGSVTDTIYEKIWAQNTSTGGLSFASTAGATEIYRDGVSVSAWTNSQGNLTSTTTAKVIDCYLDGGNSAVASGIVMGSSSAADAGLKFMSRNTIRMGWSVFLNAAGATTQLKSAFNDWILKANSAHAAIEAVATGASVLTSDNDYISGTNGAARENVDTSMSTSSTASPAQYSNLTAARTNAKGVPNKPLTADNTVVGSITSTAATITFDSANGVVPGQGSTSINVDSSSGQAVINVASVTGFEVGEIVEIGYGTARSETGRILSIGASSITLETNLLFTHTAVQADTVTKQLRNWGIPFVRVGTASGVYPMRSNLPPSDDWGLVFTGIKTTIAGGTFAFSKTGHSVPLTGLDPNTLYYIQVGYYTPLGDVAVGAETTFTTAPSTTGGEQSHVFVM